MTKTVPMEQGFATTKNWSGSSDVYAFGVTLWEVFSLCQSQPLFQLTNDKILDNLSHLSHLKFLIISISEKLVWEQ